jgi:hypothetical protein
VKVKCGLSPQNWHPSGTKPRQHGASMNRELRSDHL